MRHAIFLNRWGMVFHVILAAVTEEESRNIASRICTSLEEARRLVEAWKLRFAVAPVDIIDNSRLDMNELLAGVGTDFDPTIN